MINAKNNALIIKEENLKESIIKVFLAKEKFNAFFSIFYQKPGNTKNLPVQLKKIGSKKTAHSSKTIFGIKYNKQQIFDNPYILFKNGYLSRFNTSFDIVFLNCRKLKTIVPQKRINKKYCVTNFHH